MSKLNSLLIGRFRSQPKKDKMGDLVVRSTEKLSAQFADLFQVISITEGEKEALQALLEQYQTEEVDVTADLSLLSLLTSEIKAISHQAVLLHGERVKKAQEVLKKYRSGAFSQWLLKTYGNRQTPYNFMQYYELHLSLPKSLQGVMERMPRQAIYSLSSRSISQEKKVAFVEGYQGESKAELLEKLRKAYPLDKGDKRRSNQIRVVLEHVRYAIKGIRDEDFLPSNQEMKELEGLARELIHLACSHGCVRGV